LLEAGGSDDLERGLKLLDQSCLKLGSPQGCIMYARALLLHPKTTRAQKKQGVELAGALCLEGEPQSCLMAAAGYVEARGVPRDLERGARFLVFACKGGFAPACDLQKRMPPPLIARLEKEFEKSKAQAIAEAQGSAAPPIPSLKPPGMSLLPSPQ